ncbi:DUF3574 domain-containing protein [Streptomyces bambusae]|uniref:DUF3574 domain-containing protein n=1 Tax=Streptomyces bambusae TaxID=1550616 RepID=A0ABS6ZAT6_9ACTN|nr:DUF3574 domain-containing protein [Streptomyces bambusae]MBW5483785.1 DUF3574 domain-containing protein [Streptomyces bambusae]
MRQIRITTPAAAVLAVTALLLTFGRPAADVVLGAPASSAQVQTTGQGGQDAPQGQEAAVLAERGRPYVSTHLYFGTGRHDGHPPITDDEFMKFVADVVTPRFPEGLTLQEARGQWRDKDGDINREKSYELTVLYPVTEARARDADIEHIRRLYCTMYGLESVGRADVLTRADF